MRKEKWLASFVLGGILCLAISGFAMAEEQQQICPGPTEPAGLQAARYIQGLINMVEIDWEQFMPLNNYIGIDEATAKVVVQFGVENIVPGCVIDNKALNNIIETAPQAGVGAYVEERLTALYPDLMGVILSNLDALVNTAYITRDETNITLIDAVNMLGGNADAALRVEIDKIKKGELLTDVMNPGTGVIAEIIDFEVPLAAIITQNYPDFTLTDDAHFRALAYVADSARFISEAEGISAGEAVNEIAQSGYLRKMLDKGLTIGISGENFFAGIDPVFGLSDSKSVIW